MASPELHFIISAPRSGSTWLANTLNHHPEVFATEHRLFGQFCEVWKNNDGSTSPRITFDSYVDAFSRHYFHDQLGMDRGEFQAKFQRGFANFLVGFATRRSNKRVVVDKITPYRGTTKLVVQQIRALLPDAKIIQLVRDGRDVVTSGAFDWLQREDVDTPRRAFFVDQSRSHLDRFFDDQILADWAGHWQETIVEFANTPNLVQVRYEDMKKDQPEQLLRIFEAIGVEGDLAAAEKCATMTSFKNSYGREAGDHQPTAKARKGVVGDWENYFTRADGLLFQEKAGEAMRLAGYESDSNWIDELPNALELGRT